MIIIVTLLNHRCVFHFAYYRVFYTKDAQKHISVANYWNGRHAKRATLHLFIYHDNCSLNQEHVCPPKAGKEHASCT